MADRVLIPLPGIGTLSLTRSDYEAALIPIAAAGSTKAAGVATARAGRHASGVRGVRATRVALSAFKRGVQAYRGRPFDNLPNDCRRRVSSATQAF